MITSLSTLAAIGLVSGFLISLIIIYLSAFFFPLRETVTGVQNSHQHATNRFGGVAICLAVTLVIVCRKRLEIDEFPIEIQLLFFFSCFALGVGFLDDVVGHIRPVIRILLIILVAYYAGAYLGWLEKVNIDILDSYVQNNRVVACAITIFAVVGLTNSFNLIDGLNGLCGGTTIIIICVLIFLARILGLHEFVIFYEMLIFCILGFLVCNFPFGKIFLGDGGAYFLGFLIAQSCIFLNSIDGPISSWVFVLACIYPIWETLFAFSRRLVKRKKWTVADRGHLHQLIYDSMSPAKGEYHSIKRNAVAASICLIFPTASGALCVAFYDHSLALKVACIGFISVYLLLYFFLSKKISKRGVAIMDN